ncbi:MAG: D-alanyl-D-alanine carboxypeptidase [Eubacteriaceae bacterium]|nr:D-alanyl-D-alanine carboxypeptidase [Eubacteriaceae bacterium]
MDFAKDRFRRISALLLAVSLLLGAGSGCAYAFSIDSWTPYGDMGLYVVELNSGTVLASNREDERMYPGSLTKVMSAMVSLDLCGEDETVTITAEMLEMVGYDSSVADLLEGETLSVRELLYASLIPSGNDAAISLAVYAGSKIAGEGASAQECCEAFVSAMNDKRGELGMSGTHFANADGYDDWSNYSTPRDMAVMAQAAVRYELIKRICSMDRVSITTNLDTHTWYTTNLLHTEVYYEWGTEYENGFYIPCVDGIKTGYTDMGQRCLLFSFSSEGMDVIGAMLNVPTDDMDEIWHRSYALVNEVVSELCIQYPVNDDNRRTDLAVANHALFSDKTVTLWAEEDLVFIGEKQLCSEGLEWHLEYDPQYIEVLKRGRLKLLGPLKAGDSPASMVFTSVKDGSVQAVVRLVTVEDFRIFSWPDILFIAVAALFAVSMVLGIRRRMRQSRTRRRNAR